MGKQEKKWVAVITYQFWTHLFPQQLGLRSQNTILSKLKKHKDKHVMNSPSKCTFFSSADETIQINSCFRISCSQYKRHLASTVKIVCIPTERRVLELLRAHPSQISFQSKYTSIQLRIFYYSIHCYTKVNTARADGCLRLFACSDCVTLYELARIEWEIRNTALI